MKFYTLILGFLSLVVKNESANILGMFPVPSISHQVVFRAITQELARRGHNVTVITPDPVFEKGRAPENLIEIDVHDISYGTWEQLIPTLSTGAGDIYEQLRTMVKIVQKLVEIQFLSEQLQNVLHENNKFDVVLVEAGAPLTLILSHIFEAPLIQISSLTGMHFNYEFVGAARHFSLYPEINRKKIFNLTFSEKLIEYYNYRALEKMIDEDYIDTTDMNLQRIFGSDIPSFNELVNNIDMFFINVKPIWDSNRPVPPNVVYLGGLHQVEEKELPKSLQEYLNSSPQGVIYVSFGTNVNPSLFDEKKIASLVSAFSKLPYNILWKWNNNSIPALSNNVKTSKWFPQSDLLRHPNIKLFITQAGLQSTDEAINCGVPLLAIPQVGDQFFNADMYVKHGIGIRIDTGSLTEKTLIDGINTVIGNPSYRENILRFRTLIHDEPMKPLDKAVWWTEYVIRHKGAKHLKAPSANLSWSQYYEVELLLLAFGAVLLMVLFCIIFIFGLILRNVRNCVLLKCKKD